MGFAQRVETEDPLPKDIFPKSSALPIDVILGRRNTHRAWIEAGDARDFHAFNWYETPNAWVAKEALLIRVKNDAGVTTDLPLVRIWDEKGLRELEIGEFAGDYSQHTAQVDLCVPDYASKFPIVPRLVITPYAVFANIKDDDSVFQESRGRMLGILDFMRLRFEGINPVGCPDIPLATMIGNPRR